MRILVTGGGTGGHISPALAIVQELRRRDPQLLLRWVGRSGGMEERVCAANDIPFRGIPVEGWPRRRSPRRIWVALKALFSIVRALMFVRAFRPQAVIGVGGYVSLPALLAAQLLGIPTLIHEQNKRLGMANRMTARRAAKIFLSYPETIGAFPRERARVIGNPVRTGFAAPPARHEACAALGLDAARPVVLVCGGSQGAESINRAVAAMLPALAPDELQLLWMTGPAGAPAARAAANTCAARVEVYPYIEDMVTVCAAADLIVGRAGASSTAELAVLGKPSILVPYPHAADNHQEDNARAFEAAGAAVLVLDPDCAPERLIGALRVLLADPDRRAVMSRAALSLARPLAREEIAEEVIRLVMGSARG